MENFQYQLLAFNLKRIYTSYGFGDGAPFSEKDIHDVAFFLYKNKILSAAIFNEIELVFLSFKNNKKIEEDKISKINEVLYEL